MGMRKSFPRSTENDCVIRVDHHLRIHLKVIVTYQNPSRGVPRSLTYHDSPPAELYPKLQSYLNSDLSFSLYRTPDKLIQVPSHAVRARSSVGLG
jgi:hypothetical protein